MPPSRRTEAGYLRVPRRLVAPAPAPKPGSENLRRYLQTAYLPSISRNDSSHPYFLPRRGRRSHKNRLRVQKDPERHIDQIRQHDPKAFNKAARLYNIHHIYGRDARPFAGKHYENRDGEALVLPTHYEVHSEGTFDNIPYPSSIEETCQWLTDRPFKTMQRAMHLAFPDTTRWWLDEAEPLPGAEARANGALWRTYLWRFHPDEHQETWWRDTPESTSGAKTEPAPRNSMVFIVQPPWILALQDMNNLAKCTSLPSLPDDDVPPESRLNCSQRVWANLLDTCKHHDCQDFVLTTYHGWMFGSFSKDWTSARISEKRDFDVAKPNVMQSLVYWIACSMGLVGAEHPVEPPVETEREVPYAEASVPAAGTPV
ncbi:hypothetical protein JB92DRAFT_3140913 [Gautieria morchelliformis]|nr:hypothetical protein JB92DRAFT_3140913 [Gautieria morchelliformis]